MNNRLILVGAVVLGWMLSGSLPSAFAFPVILDSTNSYSADIEPGANLSQPEFIFSAAFIVGTGVEFAIGDSAHAVFPGITHLGGGSPTPSWMGIDPWI